MKKRWPGRGVGSKASARKLSIGSEAWRAPTLENRAVRRGGAQARLKGICLIAVIIALSIATLSYREIHISVEEQTWMRLARGPLASRWGWTLRVAAISCTS